MNDKVCLITFPDDGRIYMAADDEDSAWNGFNTRYPGSYERSALTFEMITADDVPEGAEIQ